MAQKLEFKIERNDDGDFVLNQFTFGVLALMVKRDISALEKGTKLYELIQKRFAESFPGVETGD